MSAPLTIHTRNVTRAFRAATDDDRSAGREWYARAHALAVELDPADPRRGAAVIAVLSPMASWPRNVQLARDAYAGRPIGCLGRNADKARRILSGEDPDSVVSGDKVRAFWQTIADPSATDVPVTIDRHALDIAAGRVLDDATRGAHLRRKGAYAAAGEAYRRAARILSRETGEEWTAPAVQAVTWTYWRRERAQAFHGDLPAVA